MPTDPFVSPELDDLPRQEPNLAPGVHLPAAAGWRGRPARRSRRRAAHRHAARPARAQRRLRRHARRSACATRSRSRPTSRPTTRSRSIAELAMKRAASFGRAPMHGRRRDRGVAARLPGRRRPRVRAVAAGAVHGADHEYGVRRAIVDAVPDAVLRMPPQVPALLEEFRAELRTTTPVDRAVLTRRALTIRVRFSPAPTGSLHIGSARTALFNWLFARHHGGDVRAAHRGHRRRPRVRDEWVVGIQDTLRVARPRLGRRARSSRASASSVYLAAADRLLAPGDAYECYCTEDEVRERNDAAVAAGPSAGLRRPLPRPHARRARRAARPRAGRGRPVPHPRRRASSSFTDLIRGEVRVEWALIHDFVIVRSDGAPIFFLANAVDDIDMGITHVIRGEDLIDSTHRVLALRAALGGGDAAGVRAPAADRRRRVRAKLSKRHGAVAVEEFRADGYLPEALLNYLALLGWAPGRRRRRGPRRATSSSREFDLDRVTHAAGGVRPRRSSTG